MILELVELQPTVLASSRKIYTDLSVKEVFDTLRLTRIKKICIKVLCFSGAMLIFSLVSMIVQAAAKARGIQQLINGVKDQTPWTYTKSNRWGPDYFYTPRNMAGQVCSGAFIILSILTAWVFVAALCVTAVAVGVLAYIHFKHADLDRKLRIINDTQFKQFALQQKVDSREKLLSLQFHELYKQYLKKQGKQAASIRGTKEFYQNEGGIKVVNQGNQELVSQKELQQIQKLEKIKKVLRLISSVILFTLLGPLLMLMPFLASRPSLIFLTGQVSYRNGHDLHNVSKYYIDSGSMMGPVLLVNLIFLAVFTLGLLVAGAIYFYSNRKQQLLERKAIASYSPLFAQFVEQMKLTDAQKLDPKLHQQYAQYKKIIFQKRFDHHLSDKLKGSLKIGLKEKRELQEQIELWKKGRKEELLKERQESVKQILVATTEQESLSQISSASRKASVLNKGISLAKGAAYGAISVGIAYSVAKVAAGGMATVTMPKAKKIQMVPGLAHHPTHKTFASIIHSLPQLFTMLFVALLLFAVTWIVKPFYKRYKERSELELRKAVLEDNALFKQFLIDYQLEDVSESEVQSAKLYAIFEQYRAVIAKAKMGAIA